MTCRSQLVSLGVLCCLGSLLTGCGAADSGNPGSSTVTPSTTASTPEGPPPLGGTITVLAAASLTDVFGEIGDAFEAAHPGVTVTFSFGASSALATQVTQGAPADVLATANTSTMQQVVDAGGAGGPTQIFARNVLEIVVPKGNPGQVTSLADLAKPDLVVALCAPEVPCGSATQKLLDLVGVKVEPDSLEVDVRAALTKVQLGEVDAALVYRTDVAAGGLDIEGIEIPEAAEVVNDYPIVTLVGSENAAAAAAFVAYVRSDPAAEKLVAAGFLRP